MRAAACKRLLRDADGPVYLTVDSHRAHRARAGDDALGEQVVAELV